MIPPQAVVRGEMIPGTSVTIIPATDYFLDQPCVYSAGIFYLIEPEKNP
jgi:hypothetical protein